MSVAQFPLFSLSSSNEERAGVRSRNQPAMFRKVCARFPPGSAQDNLGRLATLGTIVPVPPDRIPAPLPPNLNPRLVISVQSMIGYARTEDQEQRTKCDQNRN